MALSERQQQILATVVREYYRTGRPVGSKAIAAGTSIAAGPSTVRAELALLETEGLLAHPHTSAGRVPTTSGYRYYVDELLASERSRARNLPVANDFRPDRMSDAIDEVTAALSTSTGLLALATSPATRGTSIRRIEVIEVQPQVVVVIAITDAGDVARHREVFDMPLDPGLLEWAADYLNDQLRGRMPGKYAIRNAIDHPDLSPLERAMLQRLAPVFDEIVGDDFEMHVGGAAQVVEDLANDRTAVAGLMRLLDERRQLLGVLRGMLGAQAVTIRVGDESDLPELQHLSVVAGRWGTGVRPTGIVGVIGPHRMDYPDAVASVRHAATLLGSVADELFEPGEARAHET